MKILGDRVLVSRIEEVKKEGEFEKVNVHDSFEYKGKVVDVNPLVLNIAVGDTVLFAKYSPDTHEVETPEGKMKLVLISDILAIL